MSVYWFLICAHLSCSPLSVPSLAHCRALYQSEKAKLCGSTKQLPNLSTFKPQRFLNHAKCPSQVGGGREGLLIVGSQADGAATPPNIPSGHTRALEGLAMVNKVSSPKQIYVTSTHKSLVRASHTISQGARKFNPTQCP